MESLQPQTGTWLQRPTGNERRNDKFAVLSNPHIFSLTASLSGSVLVLLLSIFAIKQRFKSSRFLLFFYQDEDGEATPKAIDNASKHKVHRVSLICVGFGVWLSILQVSFAILGLETAQIVDWAQMAIWAMLVLQCSTLWKDSPIPITYAIGWRVSLSCMVAVLNLCIQMYVGHITGHHDIIKTVIMSCQTIFGLSASFLTLLIPRRPDVYRNGEIVDRQNSTSFLGWLSFTWTESILHMAKRKTRLQISDLPELDYNSRTDSVLHTCCWMVEGAGAGTRGLWMIILRSQGRALLFQCSITVVSSFLSFVPPFALLNILLALEGQQNGDENETRIWLWVIGLGVSVMVTATLETLKYWISYNKLTIRTQEQLSVAIFDKAIRLDEVGTENASDANRSQEQSSQGPVHMAVIDAKNIADFVCLLFFLYETPLKLIIALVFLFVILGWQCLLSCIIVMLVLSAANSHTVKRYSKSQGIFMQSRDHRLSAITEILQGIRHLKLSAHESQWGEKVNQLRDTELRARWSVYSWELIMVSMYFFGPTTLSAASLTVYVAVNGSLSAATAFTSIAILNSIEVSLAILPEIIGMLASASVSIKRISRFLTKPERTSSVLPSDTVEFTNATVAWPGSATGNGEGGTLKDLNLKFPKDALSVIIGPTGAGKSLLLAAILGECDVLCGTIKAPTPVKVEDVVCDSTSGIAYVPQVPWIERGTIKNNIVFGTRFNKERYSQVLFACAMEKDLERLPNGDLTEVGTNGANMSGGQKWRLCLARALYSRAHTLVLDDIFSAVDVHTRQHIYQNALVGELAEGRTRILVTHHVGICLPHANYLVSLYNGTLKDALDAKDLEMEGAHWDQIAGPANTAGTFEHHLPPQTEDSQAWGTTSGIVVECHHDSGLYWDVCKSYIKEGGFLYEWLVVLAAFLGYSGFMLGRTWWLNVWTSQGSGATPENKQAPGKNGASIVDQSLLYYLLFYLGISALACAIGTARCYFTFRVTFRASRKLFRRMLYTVLRAPLQWHDDVPFGRVLNRFSSDFNIVDSHVGEDLRSTLEFITDMAMAMLAGILVNPALLVVAALLTVLYLHYSKLYLAASRQVKRLESEAKSPIFDHFESCLNGLPVIRAFGKVDEYRQLFRQNVDFHARAFWHLWLLKRWLGFRINMIGAAFSALSAALVVSLKDIDASAAGFAISFTMQVSLSMALAIRYYADLEQDMNSVERVLEYSRLSIENYEGLSPPANWPTSGQLEVSNLAVRYAPHEPLILHGVSFKAEGNQRVGVVGRTGSGKSSLVNAIFRILEPCEGQIFLDGVDISKLRLEDLRGRLGIIPQIPAIFRGTIRSNLDPFDEYEDTELLHALNNVGWLSKASLAVSDNDSVVQPSTSQLERIVAERGTNLSQGQRQLLCIAREIIRKPKLLVLDEATSAVDEMTDQLIQQSVRSASSRDSTTLLVIAHRLSTVADFDSILVLDTGRVVEFGSPRDLLGMENGVFKGMVEQDAERYLLKRIISGAADIES